MINLAPWNYRDLLVTNRIIKSPVFYEINLIDGTHYFESTVTLQEELKPQWVRKSELYKNCDGSGTSVYKNTAVYKAISEALERLAFYELADSEEKKYSFDLNPTTTGMAAFPGLTCKQSRNNAFAEAIERWAIHEFNKNNIPVIKLNSLIKNLDHYELITPFNKVKVSLLAYNTGSFYIFGFAGGVNIKHSHDRALIELDRNERVLTKFLKNKVEISKISSMTDKALIFYSTNEGYSHFDELIFNAPKNIKNINPKILCDLELKGFWTKYTKIWRFLLEDSFHTDNENYKFFMF